MQTSSDEIRQMIWSYEISARLAGSKLPALTMLAYYIKRGSYVRLLESPGPCLDCNTRIYQACHC